MKMSKKAIYLNVILIIILSSCKIKIQDERKLILPHDDFIRESGIYFKSITVDSLNLFVKPLYGDTRYDLPNFQYFFSNYLISEIRNYNGGFPHILTTYDTCSTGNCRRINGLINPSGSMLAFFNPPFKEQAAYIKDSIQYIDYYILEHEIQRFFDPQQDDYHKYKGSLYRYLMLLNNEKILGKKNRPIRDMFVSIKASPKEAILWNEKDKRVRRVKKNIDFFLNQVDSLDLSELNGMDSLYFVESHFIKPTGVPHY